MGVRAHCDACNVSWDPRVEEHTCPPSRAERFFHWLIGVFLLIGWPVVALHDWLFKRPPPEVHPGGSFGGPHLQPSESEFEKEHTP